MERSICYVTRVKQLVDASVNKQQLASPQPKDPLYLEILQHWLFAKNTTKQLQGRTKLLQVTNYFLFGSMVWASLQMLWYLVLFSFCFLTSLLPLLIQIVLSNLWWSFYCYHGESTKAIFLIFSTLLPPKRLDFKNIFAKALFVTPATVMLCNIHIS